MAKINVSVDLPDGLLRDFLQAIRDFDAKHDPNHAGSVQFKLHAVATGIPVERMREIFKSLDPPFECEFVLMNGKPETIQ